MLPIVSDFVRQLNPNSLWWSGLLRAPCVIYALFASLTIIACLFGYGSWVNLVIAPATIVLVFASLGAASVYGNLIKYAIR